MSISYYYEYFINKIFKDQENYLNIKDTAQTDGICKFYLALNS